MIRFITIAFFVHEMMGKRSKNWFYNHRDEPDFPNEFTCPAPTARC